VPTVSSPDRQSVEATPSRGHKKRERTRHALLDAALNVVAEEGEGFSLGSVTARAGVAHGTFYNYFDDRGALMDALVAHSVEKFARRAALEVEIDDEAVRFAVISARALRTAAESPNTVKVALRVDSVRRALAVDGPLSYLRRNLVDGHRAGRFSEAPDDGTLDVILGALLLAARRVINGESDHRHRVAVITRLLMSLGIESSEAHTIAERAVESHDVRVRG
jgi:AcrR family transcriptional regulator